MLFTECNEKISSLTDELTSTKSELDREKESSFKQRQQYDSEVN